MDRGVRDGRVQVSMMDVDVFESILKVLSDADGARRGGAARGNGEPTDALGDIHLLLFCDFKQLPPATGKAPDIPTDRETERQTKRQTGRRIGALHRAADGSLVRFPCAAPEQAGGAR